MSTIKEWVERALAEVALRNPITAHIKDFYGSRKTLTESIEAFVQLVECLDLETFIPLLILPLEDSETLSLMVPPWSELKWDQDDEPPSLGIAVLDSRKLVESVEEYRCPLDPPPHLASLRGVAWIAYYRCFRSLYAKEMGWEYCRCMYIEAVPSTWVM
jgi:hypothetical protein